jgi:hypothetical protein
MKGLGWLFFATGTLVTLIGVLLLIALAVDWLDTGQWRMISMDMFIGEKPATTMVGLQKISPSPGLLELKPRHRDLGPR